MEVVEYNMPKILRDNEEKYIQMVIAILEAIDPQCTLQITRKISAYNFRIAPSAGDIIETMIKDIQTFNTMLNIRVDFSKSMKSSSCINFDISIN
jgi:hypothetical protein